MKLVQPIRNKEIVNQMGEVLKEMNDKYYVMFRIGVTSGLRISDILNIKVKDVKSNYIQVTEQKTQKTRIFKLNSKTKSLCIDFIEANNLKDNDYIIYSNKKDSEGNIKPISRQQAHHVLKLASDKLGMEDVGTHTLRKTFGYWHYKQYGDVAILQDIFNHSAPSITLRYIGITQDKKDETIQGLSIINNIYNKNRKK